MRQCRLLVLPFWGLSLCRCLGSRALQGWQGSRPHSPYVTRPLVAAEDTGRPPRSRGWHRGWVLMCTESKARRNPSDAPVTSHRPNITLSCRQSKVTTERCSCKTSETNWTESLKWFALTYFLWLKPSYYPETQRMNNDGSLWRC